MAACVLSLPPPGEHWHWHGGLSCVVLLILVPTRQGGIAYWVMLFISLTTPGSQVDIKPLLASSYASLFGQEVDRRIKQVRAPAYV